MEKKCAIPVINGIKYFLNPTYFLIFDLIFRNRKKVGWPWTVRLALGISRFWSNRPRLTSVGFYMSIESLFLTKFLRTHVTWVRHFSSVDIVVNFQRWFLTEATPTHIALKFENKNDINYVVQVKLIICIIGFYNFRAGLQRWRFDLFSPSKLSVQGAKIDYSVEYTSQNDLSPRYELQNI